MSPYGSSFGKVINRLRAKRTYLEQCVEGVVTQWLRQASSQCLTRPARNVLSTTPQPEQDDDIPQVVAEAQVTPDDVFEQAYRLSFDQLVDHVAKDRADSVEPFIRVADVR